MTTETPAAAVQAEIDHAMSTLTAEERAAMADDDAPSADLLKAVAGDDADDEDDDKDEDVDPPEEGKPAAPAAAPAADDATPPPAAAPAAPAPAPAAAEEDEDEALPPPSFQFKLPEDFEQQTADVKAAKAAVYQRLKDGEISVEDLPSELESLTERERALERMQIQAEVARQSEEASRANYQRATIDKAFKAAKADGIDYKGADADKIADLDMFMKALAGKDENADKPYKWFLAEAHKRVLAMHGKAAAAPAPASPPAPAAKPAPRKAPIDAVPASLANVPGGDGPGDVGGEFADVLALEGEEYERAIAAMAKRDPAKFERFQQSA